MANEAYIKQEHDDQYRYWTVADGTAIEKGTLMVIDESATRTAKKHSGAVSDYPVGFAVQEKEANDGQTKIAVQAMGVVDAVADGTIDEGDLCDPGETANKVQAAATDDLSLLHLRKLMGFALEAASDGDRFKLRLNIGQ